MVDVKVMSWNVQKFGYWKCFDIDDDQTGFISFVAQVIRENGVHIAGFMEVFEATAVSNLLLRELAQGYAEGASPWRSCASSPQDCNGAAESYLYVYDTSVADADPNAIPGPFFSLTFADPNAFTNFDRIHGFSTNAAADAAMNTWLAGVPLVAPLANGRPYRTVASACETLWQNRTNLAGVNNFTPPNPPNGGEYGTFLANVARSIYYLDMNYCPTATDRTPFIGCFTVNNRPLVTALFHAPGTGDNDRFPASNIPGQSRFLQDQENVLVMGDFNIRADEEGANDVTVYGYDATATRWQATNQQTSPFEFIKTANGPAGGTGLNAQERLNTPTSISSLFPVGNPNSTAVRANPYDRFFYKGNGITMLADPEVVDIVEFLCVGRNDTEASRNAAWTATIALARYKTYQDMDWTGWFQNKIDMWGGVHNTWQNALTTRQNTLTAAQTALQTAIAATEDITEQADLQNGPLGLRVAAAMADVQEAQDNLAGCVEAGTCYTALRQNIGNGYYAEIPDTATAWVVTTGMVSDHLPILATLSSP